MSLKLNFAQICGALAVLAALSFAPSAAQAHAGHVHAQPAVVTAGNSGIVNITETADRADAAIVHAAQVHVDLKAGAGPLSSSGLSNCGNGCCSSVPCTTCIGLLAPPEIFACSTSDSGSRLEPADASASNGLGPDGIRRPPRSFV
jgi:hypothetical protein